MCASSSCVLRLMTPSKMVLQHTNAHTEIPSHGADFIKMMKETPGWSWRSSHRQQQQTPNNPILTWASLQFLAPKKEDDGSKLRRRRGNETSSSISKSRPRFAAPTTASSHHCDNRENGTSSANNNKDEVIVQRRLEPIHSYLMLSTADGDVNTRSFDDHLESSNHPYTIGNVSIHKSSPHSSNYQVECMGEKFTGFHRILFDDTSFYKAEVSPLAREFVNKKRNICIIVHGAHGTGRRRALFGDQRKNEVLDNNYISSSLNELCANPYRRRQESDDHDDSVSSIGSQGVSEVQNIKNRMDIQVRPKVQIIPQEVSFSVESSSSVGEEKRGSYNYGAHTLSDAGKNTGMIPKLMEDICKRLCKHHPRSGFWGGGIRGGDVPLVIPSEQSSSKCLLTSNIKNNDDAKQPYSRSHSMDTTATDNAYITQGNDSFIGVRVSCFEIVDDLASGETTTHDLLSECVQTEKWPVAEIASDPKKQDRRYTYDTSMKSAISWGDGEHSSDEEDVSVHFGKSQEESSAAPISKDIIHDPATGIVYVENSLEVRCLSKSAILECLTKAEEVRQRRKNGEDVMFGKLSHTVYLLSIEHDDQTSLGKIALTRQIVISTVDETMSNSASLALHSSCSALNTVTRQLANYVATPPSRRNALTQLLSGCIGGNCRTLVLGTADPTNDDITLPTLRFGEAISWVYNYWTGEDVLDTDSDSSDVELPAADSNVDCIKTLNNSLNDSSKEKSTPATETSSYQAMDSPQSNSAEAIKKKDRSVSFSNDYENDTREIPQMPMNTQSSNSPGKTEEDRGQDHYDDDSSWRATLAQIGDNLDLVRAKMKPKKPRKTVDDGPLKADSKTLEPASLVELPDYPSAGGNRIQMNKAKDDKSNEMRAEIEALRQERDSLRRRDNERELELEKAREDIFHLKLRQREDMTVENRLPTKPAEPKAKQISEVIKVCFRLRPKNKLESYRRSTMCIDASENSPNVRIDSSLYGTHNFFFDKVFGEDSSQRTVSDFFTEQFTSKLLNGVNCALILAGAKSSGKSHSLFGEIPSASKANECSLLTTDAGILPNIACGLFRKMRASNSTVSYTVKCSFVMLHLERIIDLLRPQPSETETIFASYSSEGLKLDGATESYCSEEEDVMDVIRRGKSFQCILSDAVSAENDLFHTCFLLKVESSAGKCATLLLSEMFGFGATKKSNAAGYLAAGPHQRSSAALNRVVGALTRGGTAEVPYQLSKMTSLLRDALGGNCSTTVLITASPCKTTFTDTLDAIKLGLKVRNVRNTLNPNAAETEDAHNTDADDKLRSMILDSQSKMTLLKQQHEKILREKQATEDALAEERQRMKIVGLEKEQINLELKRMKLREKRATEFIKCLRGLVSHVKNDSDDSRTMAIDQVIEMIGSDIDLGDLVDIDILLQNEGFISKDEASLAPDDLFNKLLGSESSEVSPTDVFSAGEGIIGDSNGVRILRRDMRKIAKANVELQVSLKKEREFVKSIVKAGDINTDKLANEAVAMRKSRDKMTNCALTAVNKLNEVSNVCRLPHVMV